MNQELTTTIPENALTHAGELPLDQNPAAVYLASLNSPTGRRGQRQALNEAARLLGTPTRMIEVNGRLEDWTCLDCHWAGLRYQHTAALRAQLAARYKAATANKFLSAIRQVLWHAWQLHQMTEEDRARAASMKNITASTVPAGRELQPGEISGLLASCEKDPTPAGARDAAIIAILYAIGIRREEVVGLDLEDYDPQTGRLLILGKRNKERTSYLTNGAAMAMADWQQLRGPDPGPLFWPVNKGGRMENRRLTNQAIYNMLAKRAEEAGVRKFTPHDLRRTFVSDLLDAGADIATVAKMAGHANVQTTARYDRRPEQAKQRAAGLLHVPYHSRKPER